MDSLAVGRFVFLLKQNPAMQDATSNFKELNTLVMQNPSISELAVVIKKRGDKKRAVQSQFKALGRVTSTALDGEVAGDAALENAEDGEMDTEKASEESASDLGADSSSAQKNKAVNIINLTSLLGIRTVVSMYIPRSHTKFLCQDYMKDTKWWDMAVGFLVTAFMMMTGITASMQYDKESSRDKGFGLRMLRNVAPLFPLYWLHIVLMLPLQLAPCFNGFL